MDSLKTATEVGASVATILGFGTVIVASLAALRQVREMAQSRQLEGLIQLFEVIGAENARANRKHVYTQLPDDPALASDDDWAIADGVSVELDRIGVLVTSGLVPEGTVFDSHCEVFLRLWAKLEPYVMARRQQLGRNSQDLWIGFLR